MPTVTPSFAPFPFPFDKPQGQRKHLKSFEAFARMANQHSNHHGIAWRGQADASWRVTSSAFRSERERLRLYSPHIGPANLAEDIPSISRHVEERVAYASRAVQRAIGTDDHLRVLYQGEILDREIHDDPIRYGELLAICQHFGMATPLIDVTDSAYVALFFASWYAMKKDADWRAKSRMAVWKLPANHFREPVPYTLVRDQTALDLANRQSCYDANPTSPLANGSKRITISNVNPRKFRNERLVAQQGSFIRVQPDLPLDHVLAMMHVRAQGTVFEPFTNHLVQYTLPAGLALDCLVHLTKMNIRPDTLFPDLIGQMDFINFSSDHYDYSGMTERLRGSMFEANGTRRSNFRI